MKKIIALRGAGNSGKTTTIRLLHTMLTDDGHQPIYTTFHEHRDFRAVFIIDGIRIGITSWGDNYETVHNELQRFVSDNCTIIVCACRTQDRANGNGVIMGTNTAIRGFTDYESIFVPKIQNREQQDDANMQDAKTLLTKIKAMIPNE